MKRRTGLMRVLATVIIGLVWVLSPGGASAATGWTTMAPLLTTARQYLGATTGPCPGTTGLATDRQCLYAIGGSKNTGGLDGGELSSVEFYDPSATTPKWATMTPMLNTARQYLGASTAPCLGTNGLATAKQCLYAVAGADNNNTFNTVETFDPSATTPSWTTMTPTLHTARANLGTTTAPCPRTSGLSTAKRCLYAIGGEDATFTPINTVEYFDPSAPTPAWTATAMMNAARLDPGTATAPCPETSGLATDEQCLYAIGGFVAHASTNTVEYYDPSAMNPIWTATAQMNMKRLSLGATTAPCPGTGGLATNKQCLYAIGGVDTDGSTFFNYLNTVEYFDPSVMNSAWTATATMNMKRDSLGTPTGPCPGSNGLATDKQCVYAISGYNGDTFSLLRSVEYLDPSTGPTMARVVRFSVQRHGRRGALWVVTLQWRVSTNTGIASFNLYAGTQKLNARLIYVHQSRSYRYTVRWMGRGVYTLELVLRAGTRITISAR